MFWSLKLTGLNKNVLESSEKCGTVTLVIPVSRTGNMASRILNTHFKMFQPKG